MSWTAALPCLDIHSVPPSISKNEIISNKSSHGIYVYAEVVEILGDCPWGSGGLPMGFSQGLTPRAQGMAKEKQIFYLSSSDGD